MNKNFWKYFWNTLKESKFLLLRYFLVGICLIITGIIANKLNLNNLTFYNSMLTLLFFEEMISFGFIEGFGIYINQNIKDTEKSQKYAKLGFVYTIILSGFITLIFVIFPNFVIKNILNLKFEINYAFYYLMVFAIFINCLFNYCNTLQKKLGEFKQQFLATSINNLFIVISMVLILIFNSLTLTLIGLFYVVGSFLSFLLSYITLLKNKNYPINIFALNNIKITKHEFGIITSRALSEFIWEIGYLFVSLFILKQSLIIYNQYCYFENVLDFINGIFFAFVSVSSIKICRLIGEENKEEAYNIGKYSVISTIIIWIIYACLSLFLFIPLKNGMNPELQQTAFITLILFLIASLFRFSEWNLGTYVLGQSEYFAKGGFILECIFALYWFILFLISKIIPTNVFIIFGLIIFENIIKIIISLIVFKKKKWLQKS